MKNNEKSLFKCSKHTMKTLTATSNSPNVNLVDIRIYAYIQPISSVRSYVCSVLMWLVNQTTIHGRVAIAVPEYSLALLSSFYISFACLPWYLLPPWRWGWPLAPHLHEGNKCSTLFRCKIHISDHNSFLIITFHRRGKQVPIDFHDTSGNILKHKPTGLHFFMKNFSEFRLLRRLVKTQFMVIDPRDQPPRFSIPYDALCTSILVHSINIHWHYIPIFPHPFSFFSHKSCL